MTKCRLSINKKTKWTHLIFPVNGPMLFRKIKEKDVLSEAHKIVQGPVTIFDRKGNFNLYANGELSASGLERNMEFPDLFGHVFISATSTRTGKTKKTTGFPEDLWDLILRNQK